MIDLISFKHELQNIINTDESFGPDNLIKAAQNLLRRITETGAATERKKPARAEEERALSNFSDEKSLWITKESIGDYITQGAEQKVYFKSRSAHVYKIADGIFYQSWLDYFNNLLLHNSFFPTTSYSLKGFIRINDYLNVVVSQPLVVSDSQTNLINLKSFLLNIGFEHKKNNDYYHPYLGIILEDLHDENVLTSKDTFFFVDTVFYLTDQFFKTP